MTLPGLLEDGRLVYIDGPLDVSMLSVRQQLHQLECDRSSDPVTLILRCEGGEILGAFAVMDALAELQDAGITVIGIAEGILGSAGLTILQGCNIRRAGPNTLLMFHGPLGSAAGDAEARQASEAFHDLVRRRLADLYATRCSRAAYPKPWEIWYERLGHSKPTWLTAQTALADGLLDEVIG